MLKLENLSPAKGSNKTNTRVGRGQGSGGGGTAKRGHKGAQSRSGYSKKKGFEGGQMPLQRRVPKFGFKNINRVEFKAVNLDTLQLIAESTGLNTIDLNTLYNAGVTAKRDLVKVLGRGELSSALQVRANAFSKSAIEAIEKAGGSATVEKNVTIEAGEKIKISSVDKTEGKKEAPVAKKSVAAKKVDEEATPVKKAAVKKTTSAKGDDLKKIEGVGPKIAGLLNEAGIVTFQNLADATLDTLNGILAEAGSRYASHNPTTWPEQAALAAAGKWDELQVLQDNLNGGRPE
ncbi:ribosomal protein L15 [Spirosomataceae bacterium TFI 002]|nr:ribosomal protein L15 [Spirosomataceae bacterium TFI 002]